MLTPWDVQSKRINTPEGMSPTLPSSTGEGMNIQPIVTTTANTNTNGSNVNSEGVSYTLDGASRNAVAFAQNTRSEVRLFGGDGSLCGTLAANPDFGKGQGASLVCQSQYGEIAGTLNARADSSPCVDRGQNIVGWKKAECHVVSVADDTAKAAIEHDMSGSLTVGGFAVNSNGQGVVGALCACDWKGVGNEYVNEGKVICERRTC